MQDAVVKLADELLHWYLVQLAVLFGYGLNIVKLYGN